MNTIDNQPKTENSESRGDVVDSSPLPCSIESFNNWIPGEKAAEIWMELFRAKNGIISAKDPLEASEHTLYEILTKRITADLAICSVQETAEIGS